MSRIRRGEGSARETGTVAAAKVSVDTLVEISLTAAFTQVVTCVPGVVHVRHQTVHYTVNVHSCLRVT